MEHTVIPPKRKARLTGKQAIREAPLRKAVLLLYEGLAWGESAGVIEASFGGEPLPPCMALRMHAQFHYPSALPVGW